MLFCPKRMLLVCNWDRFFLCWSWAKESEVGHREEEWIGPKLENFKTWKLQNFKTQNLAKESELGQRGRENGGEAAPVASSELKLRQLVQIIGRPTRATDLGKLEGQTNRHNRHRDTSTDTTDNSTGISSNKRAPNQSDRHNLILGKLEGHTNRHSRHINRQINRHNRQTNRHNRQINRH